MKVIEMREGGGEMSGSVMGCCVGFGYRHLQAEQMNAAFLERSSNSSTRAWMLPGLANSPPRPCTCPAPLPGVAWAVRIMNSADSALLPFVAVEMHSG